MNFYQRNLYHSLNNAKDSNSLENFAISKWQRVGKLLFKLHIEIVVEGRQTIVKRKIVIRRKKSVPMRIIRKKKFVREESVCVSHNERERKPRGYRAWSKGKTMIQSGVWPFIYRSEKTSQTPNKNRERYRKRKRERERMSVRRLRETWNSSCDVKKGKKVFINTECRQQEQSNRHRTEQNTTKIRTFFSRKRKVLWSCKHLKESSLSWKVKVKFCEILKFVDFYFDVS